MAYFGVPDVVVTIFAYLHILSAISWLGAALLFTSTLAPGIRKMSTTAYLEFMSALVPRMSRYFTMAATSTVIFGPFLLATIPNFSPLLQVGILTGLAAYVEVLLEIPTFRKIAKLARDLKQAGHSGPLPAEFEKALRKGRNGTIITVALLLTTLVFMVYSAYPF